MECGSLPGIPDTGNGSSPHEVGQVSQRSSKIKPCGRDGWTRPQFRRE